MRFSRPRCFLTAMGLSGILLSGGCFNMPGFPGTSAPPGQAGQQQPPPQPGGPSLSSRPEGGFGPVGRGGPVPNGVGGSPPGPVNLAGYNALAEYQAADLSQKIAELQDENKALVARLQGLQGLLEERERAVLSSRGEVQAASQEVARARQEIARCRTEIAGLREHARAADKENQASMQALVNVLESMMDRGAPPPAAAAPVKEKETAKPAKEKH